MQDFFRYEEGYKAKADVVVDKAAKKLTKDMHYEARIQAMIQYHTEILTVRLPKSAARTMRLTPKQHLKVNIEH